MGIAELGVVEDDLVTNVSDHGSPPAMITSPGYAVDGTNGPGAAADAGLG
jgi:hypothetical protein